MKKTVAVAFGVCSSLALLAGCGSPEDQVISDFCDIGHSIDEMDSQELQAAIGDIEARIEQEQLDMATIEQGVAEQCPEVADDIATAMMGDIQQQMDDMMEGF
ncbi:hypothetical protein LRD18_02170 [Halorhodospira halochloris]|uniref:Lipoprotein n=1 Tax=Halorhodospira halochloris TaxID=1052 RepID=A0A0X8XAT1_HALHR|nr:hypothetical protein [Halorhodospira halochloris]MBK1651759.1 hypothetical protein [Halorhodospira halochloris]MCG5529680.1 hypothetical protein [Halorhodospira halochloris]MCG5548520.1 hypothetical protein [Halorhodospira halochloris]BAU58626.1 hypothetical protein HH1059_19330 [Halorhodospira halochloris]